MYDAQKLNQTNGDFVELVSSDMEKIGLELNKNSIKELSKLSLKKMVKSSVRSAAFKQL